MTETRALRQDEWALLSGMRLYALKDSPGSFLSSYEREQEYREDEWRAEFSRGEWTVADQQGAPVGLLGTTRDRNIPPDERYLEYLWVSPEFRRRGVASILINEAVQRLRQDGVSTLWLWVLDGNEPARRLYQKHGFVPVDLQQPVRHNSRHYEELMVRHI